MVRKNTVFWLMKKISFILHSEDLVQQDPQFVNLGAGTLSDFAP